MGQKIIIEESIDSYGAMIWPAVSVDWEQWMAELSTTQLNYYLLLPIPETLGDFGAFCNSVGSWSL